MPRIAFFDVDNTITRGSTLYFLGKGMYNRGFFTKRDIGAWVLANIRFRMTGTEKSEVISRFQKAATDFIGGHDVKEIRIIGEQIYSEFVSPSIWQGTIELAKEHLSSGDEVWLVTASPEDFANLIAERLGFTGAIGTKAEIKDGKYTGNLNGKLLHGKEKAIAITELTKARGINLQDCFAYSDSHNDLPLLSAVGHPRAINPDAKLRIIAFAQSWPVHDFRRLRWLNRFVGPFISRLAGFWVFSTSGIRRSSR
ncbi:MAG: HAD-IB family hydrolase [Candidatus Nanopelagicaceae bacterium]|jgi:HAD superfamily hydrolase (TIGR01490 family)|uniref:Haloacid dehalogenase n=2 Tax=ac1 cluster TaxID=1655545 RepID=A0A0R2P6K4_9ACTN|nr:MAG: haloacid dehalogenase [Actinobacteria bacterium BACL2 MAG-120802-bin41]KRO33604.1 MAG: haloacid dehalogenase [Actinobacteria bacterium BACL2 MAG-121220-bin52]KRO72342.1 MAG: haloacid dehalogenase [Actinobacteria bacterium BACL2 MAG-120920-bin34]MDP4615313.1 HAD-IB family hydrolase [Candidatus Nanopelagicales bacterium]MDP4930867.1 HAD-IB family hydrolase [Candidatus Nanopelagicaceae bacterium]